MFRNISLATAVAIALSLSSLSLAGTLVDFKPLPTSPGQPEFVFTGPAGSPSFQAGPGSIGNADGTSPVPSQTPGGFDAEAVFPILGIPGSVVNVPTTEFFDSTLTFTGLAAVGAPILLPPGPPTPGTTYFQQLGSGGFELSSTDPDGPGVLLPTLLLKGTIQGATFIAGTGDSGAVFNSGSVNYTAGAIYNALIASGASPLNNSMSISMLDVAPGFTVGPDNFLGHFTANGTGSFNYTPVPEPASVMLCAFALAGLAIGRRR